LINFPLAESRAEIELHLEQQKHLLLTAPTGTGKSSFLPWLLAGEQGRVTVLQPRQLAARELAKFLSKLYREPVGETVGYKFRFESKISKNTRILFQTYGSFLAEFMYPIPQTQYPNWLVFDEFHERRAEMDLLLGLALSKGQRVAVLSAELEREALEKYLGVECLKVENPGFPVEIIRQEAKAGEPLVSQVERAVKSALYNEINGTVLVFLPGKAEISACRARVEESLGKNSPELYSLFGGQLKEEQEKIFEPSKSTRIIFTTNIAETSLTIPNVKVVIDSGFERMAFDDSEADLRTLRLSRIAMQNAVQRTGRAGRTQKGLCIRLWSEREEANFAQSIKPEIERVNAERFLLQKKSFGVPIDLLTEMPKQKEIPALEKLKNLNLLKDEKITELGKKVLHIPVQSLELAVSLAMQKTLSNNILAIAMLLESENKSGNILHLAEDFLEGRGKWLREEKLHFEQLRRHYMNSGECLEANGLEFLMSAFPNALAFKSDGEQYYKTKDGLSVFCESKEKAILVLGLMRSENAKLQKTSASLYAPVPDKYLKSGTSKMELQWKPSQKQFVAMRVSDFGKEECSVEERKSLENQTSNAWKILMAKEDFTSQWQTEENLTLLAKMKLAAKLFPKYHFPKWNEEDFCLIMDEFCNGIFLLKDLSDERYKKILEEYFGTSSLDWLHKNFPNTLKLPNGKIAKYIYNPDGVVELSARIGDFMGMQGEHFITEKRLKVRYDILAPNYRTAQKTWNLSDFWKNTYPEVRKELRGRYPRHPWPEKI